MVDGGGDTIATPAATSSKVDPRIALRKLQSGQPLTDDEKRELGLPVTTAVTSTTISTPDTKPTWVKASTVNTANGPVDVDANGLAADGTRPVAVIVESPDTIDAGFTAGPFPKELEQFFGSSAGIIGYRIITNADGSQQLEVLDAPGSSKTFGFKFGRDNTGKYVPFKTSGGGGDGFGTGIVTGNIPQFGPGSEAYEKRKSAYDSLYEEFDRYGLGFLVSDIKNILMEGPYDPSEFGVKVRNTDAYKARFIANEARLAKGLKALSPAAYIGLEDQYQEIMRRYGLPESYYAKTGTGVQEGFRKLLENDVSNVELEDRIMTAQNRVMNANPEVLASLKQFYPDITNGDILAYTLDPKNAIDSIKRKVTAAEIGGGAMQAGLGLTGARAEELTAAGITKQQAQQGFRTVADVAPRGGQLAAIYGESPYTQQTAEQEVFGLAGSTEAAKQRKKLVGLEQAAFAGKSGTAQGALGRERAGNL